MDIWTILGLEEKTDDKEVIQEAYMERLMHVNPEDDPEGFQKLRAAFEEAMKIADGKGAEEPEEQFDDTEEGHFMKDLDAVFKDFPSTRRSMSSQSSSLAISWSIVSIMRIMTMHWIIRDSKRREIIRTISISTWLCISIVR